MQLVLKRIHLGRASFQRTSTSQVILRNVSNIFQLRPNQSLDFLLLKQKLTSNQIEKQAKTKRFRFIWIIYKHIEKVMNSIKESNDIS